MFKTINMKTGMPFSLIIEIMRRRGYECTPDDLIAWCRLLVANRMISETNVNHDTGLDKLCDSSVYRNDSHFSKTVGSYQPQQDIPSPEAPV
jgi:hypothetical protein